jgi:uncharacterized protein DUF6335
MQSFLSAFLFRTLLYSPRSPTADLGEQGKEIRMPKKRADDFEYLANNPDYVPDPEIEEFMELEISRAPKDPDLLAHRLRNNTAASPRDAGGDLDAAWEDVNDSGSETVAGDNPTPDQSLVEENASAMGVSYEDNEELEFIDKIEKRDRERYELDENSKASENMI